PAAVVIHSRITPLRSQRFIAARLASMIPKKSPGHTVTRPGRYSHYPFWTARHRAVRSLLYVRPVTKPFPARRGEAPLTGAFLSPASHREVRRCVFRPAGYLAIPLSGALREFSTIPNAYPRFSGSEQPVTG